MAAIRSRSRNNLLAGRSIFFLSLVSVQTRHFGSSFAVPSPPATTIHGHEVVRSYSLYGPGSSKTARDGGRECIGRCQEVRPPPRDPDAEEDEVELWYSTTRRSFLFPCGGPDGDATPGGTDGMTGRDDGGDEEDNVMHETTVQVTIRQTSFGCGRLGATVWPSGVALACHLSGDARHRVRGRRVLELGSGCGVPAIVARDAAGAAEVLATDFWEEEGGIFDGDRLVPKNLFGANLRYNVGPSVVRRLDWHDEVGVVAASDEYKPDLIIGSDLVYYPMDVTPLLTTLDIVMRSGAKEAILFCPLPPTAEREALPEFRTLLERADLEGCSVSMDEVEMDLDDGTDGHRFLRVLITNERETS